MSGEFTADTIPKDRYRILESREGGMGVVLFCEDLQEKRIVALKTFQDRFFFDIRILEKFRNEAGLWIGLGSHANIVQAFRLEEYNQRPFLVIEFIPPDIFYGVDLRDRLSRMIFPIPLILDLSMQFCNGMIYIQDKYKESGKVFVHGDIKPANILLEHNNHLKITDFGLAGIINELNPHQAWGTPEYMAPEIFTGEAGSGIKTDVYAFGCVLYEMICGINPFALKNGGRSGDFPIHGKLHANKIPSALSVNRKKCPRLLEDLTAYCLEKAPENRPADFHAVQKHLEEIIESDNTYGPVLLHRINNKENEKRKIENADLLWQAVSFSKLGLHSEAADICRQMLGKKQDNAVLYRIFCILGLSCSNLHENNRALDFLSRAIQTSDEKEEAYILRGQHYYNTQKYEQALKDYNKAVSCNKNNGLTYYNRGICFMRMKNPENALSDFDKAVELGFTEAYTNRGKIHFEMDNYSKALEDCNSALQRNPRNAAAYTNRGVIYKQTGLTDDALDDFDAALTINPDYILAHFHSGGIFFEQGDLPKALEYYKKGLSVKESDIGSLFEMKTDFTKEEWDNVRYMMLHDCGMIYLRLNNPVFARKYLSMFLIQTPPAFRHRIEEVKTLIESLQ